MQGTLQFYKEHFKINVMNRLIENETMSLSDQYEMCKENINALEETEELKEVYLNNLNKAYEWIQLYMIGADEELLLKA